jgi:hypothetical protein
MDDVVVFPWLPATAIVRRSAAMARCASARLYTGTLRSCARWTSALVAGIAVETTSSSTSSGTFAAA